MERIVFLGRDGTLSEEVRYLHRRGDLKPIPGVPQALRLLKQAGYRLVVVTNRIGVTRGYYKESDVETLHRYMNRVLEREGVAVDTYYYCLHHPKRGPGRYKTRCRCRKPGIDMFEMAEKGFGVDKAYSFMVGDKLLDVETGRSYGIVSILVSTGCDRERHQKDMDWGIDPMYDHYGEVLTDTARWIVEKGQV